MPFPVRSLPVLQHWDCQGCSNCCHEYEIGVTEEERQRILAQGWEQDAEIGGLPLFVKTGPWWARGYRLNHRPDEACVFLNKDGRCRIHAKFGAAAKPLACRLYPFVLVPAGDHWSVGLRYSCPAAAASKGRPLAEHQGELTHLAVLLEQQAGVGPHEVAPPRLQAGQRVDWPDLLRFVQVLLSILRDRRTRVEHRWRRRLALAAQCRQARFDKVKGSRLGEFLGLLATGLEAEVPADVELVPPPTWIGRVFFRQTLALYARKDHGPGRGLAIKGRWPLLLAAWRFARGSGSVPRVHADLPETTFQEIEDRTGLPSDDIDQVLERYYTVKVASLQFFGPTNFGMSFWEGLQSLAQTLPIILWLTRVFADLPREEAAIRAVGMVDHNFGFNPFLGTGRQRFSLRIMAGRGELERLMAWYSR